MFKLPEKVNKRVIVAFVVVAIVLVIAAVSIGIWYGVAGKNKELAPEKMFVDHTSGLTYKPDPKPLPMSSIYLRPNLSAQPNRYSTWGAELPMGDHRGTTQIV